MTGETSRDEQEYNERLQKRLKILFQQLDAGMVHVPDDMKVTASIAAVQRDAEGNFDLETVDGLVRSLSLVTGYFEDREELKEAASLVDIQKRYFQLIEINFSHFYKQMIKANSTPHIVACYLAENDESREKIAKAIPEFMGYLNEFWDAFGESAHIHIEDMNGITKGVFGGDLFPVHSENIASKCGIYTDTVVVFDPFLRSRHIFERSPSHDQVYFFIKHGLNILKYKDLACVELSIPIVTVLPDRSALEEEERDFCLRLGQEDAAVHLGKIFGQNFTNLESSLDFLGTLKSLDEIGKYVSDESRILFDMSWKRDFSTQIEMAKQDRQFEIFSKDASLGHLIAFSSVGRLATTNELLVKSQRLGGVPLIEALTSWQYLVWKLEYDAGHVESKTNSKDLHILKGLEDLAGTDMQWLGKIPANALIELRKEGALEEIRAILGQNIEQLLLARPDNFHRSRDQIFDNIQTAFSDHRKRISELRAKRWKFAGSEVGSWLASGSFAITAAITGEPLWALATIATNELTDAPKLKDIPQSFRKIVNENKKVQRSPVGMLFSLSKE